MRHAELFAGAGGMALGFHRSGMETAWVAELADFPRRVLSARFSDVPLYGDVTTLDGAALVAAHGPIGLLAGGSPCQDLSVAGKRAGLIGARSGLFHHQMRLWSETGAPLCLWENVAGALSSNNGKDFAAVLSAFVGGTIAVPRDGWTGERVCGVVSGPSGVAAWRLLDAQYFGVPQRRLRIFVLGARAGALDPAEILLEPEGVFRDSPPRRETGEGAPAGAGGRVAFSLGSHAGCDEGGVTNKSHSSGGPVGFGIAEELSNSLRAGRTSSVVAFDWQNSPSQGMPVNTDRVDPLRTNTTPAVLALDGEGNSSSRVAGALTGHHSSHCRGAVLAFNTKQDGSDADTIAPSLLAMPHDGSHPNGDGQVGVVCLTGDITHALTHEGHDASEDGTGRGTPIVYDTTQITHPENRSNPQAGDPCHPLAASAHVPLVLYGKQSFGEYGESGVASTITTRDYKDATDLVVAHALKAAGNRKHRADSETYPVTSGVPRRLMPVECERLMSWPDGWTDVPDEKGKPASDSVRYKACGNGVVSNVAQWIGERILERAS